MKALIHSLGLRLLLSTIALLWACVGSAHEFRPAYLELTQLQQGEYLFFLSAPSQIGSGQGLSMRPTGDCTITETTHRTSSRSWSVLGRLSCGSVETLMVDGLRGSQSDLMARIVTARGERFVHLHGEKSQLDLRLESNPQENRVNLLLEGMVHVWAGWDHLLYLVLLFFYLRQSLRALVIGVTAFTVGHSLSLASAVLDVVTLPARPVEAVIALTIAYFAIQLMYGRTANPRRMFATQAVIFGCGLVHGLGFAYSLEALRFGHDSLVFGLLTFNIGIELGQLGVFGALMLLSSLFSQIIRPMAEARSLLQLISCSVIGAVGCYWYFERLVV